MPIRRSLEDVGSIPNDYIYNGGSLPTVTLVGKRKKPYSTYRSYYAEANDAMLNDMARGVKSVVSGTANMLGNIAFAPLRGLFWLEHQLEKKDDSYKNATVPYGQGPGHERDNIINVRNGVIGQRDRLGMYGAVKGKDGIYRFRNPNYKSPDNSSDLESLRKELGFDDNREFLIWCAENANRLNQAMGRPTAGNAWTRHGIYGDSTIIQAPNKKSDYWFGGEGVKAKHLASDQGDYVADNIDKHDLMTGDIVDMYYRGSDFLNRAFREGDDNRTNSHTGTILRTGRDKEHTYVIHSTGNGLKVQPIGELIGSGMFKKSYITGIRRPGTKKHPYKK